MTKQHSSLNCQQIINSAAAMAVSACVTYQGCIDRNMFVRYAAAMLLELSCVYHAGMSLKEAINVAEARIPDFNQYFDYAKFTSHPVGTLLYAQAKRALMQRFGEYARIALCAKAN